MIAMEREVIDIKSDGVYSEAYDGSFGEEIDTQEQEDEPPTSIDQQTQRQYRIWKKNAPFLYDYLSTNSLLWPSLNVQFFPDVTNLSQSTTALLDEEKSNNQDELVAQRLLHGTFTLGQAVDSISILQVPTYKNLNSNININKLDYNPDKEELELSTATSSSSTKVKVLQKINHLGDVNKVRYMPQNPNIIASVNNLGDLVIYERTRHKSFKNTLIDNTDINKVQMRLVNENIPSDALTDIFALDWNKNQEGEILSGDMNGWINLYDLTKYQSEILNQSAYFKRDIEQSVGVNDIEWFPMHDSLFAVAFDDGCVEIYDKRQQKSVIQNYKISNNGVDSISLNPGFATGLATGDSNGIIATWDIRSFETPILELKNYHHDSITQLKWHPKYHNILGSSSTDHLVKLFDVTDNQQSCIFSHLGHMLGVNDFDWSLMDEWMIASVADDNSLHVWKPSHQVTDRYKRS